MRLRALLALTLAGAVAAPALRAQEDASRDTRPGVAVFPFENGGSYGPDSEDMDALAVGVQQMLLGELGQNSALRIVERGRLREILQEQDLVEQGRVDPGTAARVGRLVGARYVVLGGFTDWYGQFRMDSRIVDVETGEILESQQVQAEREEMYDLLVRLAARITEDADLPPLPSAEREAREARDIPTEAVTLFSRAQVLEDLGQTDRAEELYVQITEEFPAMTEAGEALRRVRETG